MLLAAGKLVWHVPPFFLQSHLFKGCHGPFTALAAPHPGIQQGKLHILQKVQFGKKVILLENESNHLVAYMGQLPVAHDAHVLASQQGFAIRRHIQRAYYIHQCGFPASRLSHDGHELAPVYGQVDIIVGPHFLAAQIIYLMDIPKFN